ncbi:hypothetical protein OC842_007091 [Tilletia horrida]|uniref:VWFA domain-containing protein n=1 Tax=Tilletia horrida TaxID=155126 RepID=A0AAN6G4C7_9BASI|nr:hypothetical protein OC842_007091 [Tilletia horrida]KAK0562857.1 hypothetical protein OC844_002486 [Tilletia horrida]
MTATGNQRGGLYAMFGAAAASHINQELSEAEPGPSNAPYGSAVPASANAFADPWTLEDDARALDLVFSATKNIETICDEIIRSEELSAPNALRIGLIAYRDHPPQDHTYITKNFGFTSNIEKVKKDLKSLYATGGGDGPEAVTAAMKAALDLDWRPRATKLAVLIADAPPHGIGEYGDGFPEGSPEGSDPLSLARQMARLGVSLYMVACEPALSGYQYGADFFQALVRLTGGQLLPLTTASLLSHVIIAAAGEAMELERLQREIGDAVADRLRSLSIANAQSQAVSAGAAAVATDEASMDDVARELHERLLLRNESTKQIYIESIYRQSEESAHNIRVWMSAPSISLAKGYIKKVPGSRLSDAYMATRKASTSYIPSTAATSSLGGVRTTPASAAALRSSVLHGSGRSSSASGSGASRQVVSQFSAFSASPGMSIGGGSGSNPSTSPQMGGGSGTFRGGRGMESDMMDDDDDDDMGGSGQLPPGINRDDDDDNEDGGAAGRPLPSASLRQDGVVEVAGDDGQRVAFQQAPISLEQVRRLAMQSAARGGL